MNGKKKTNSQIGEYTSLNKRTEMALREPEVRFRSVRQSANDAIIAADSKGKLISWNEGAENIFGFREEEVLGQPITVLMPKRYRDAHRKGMKRMNSTSDPVVTGKTVELHGLKKDGTEFPLELSLATWKTEQGIFYSAIIRDITERRKTEEQLFMLSRSVEQSPVSVVITDRDGAIEYVNPKFEQITGYASKEILGENPRVLNSGVHSIEFHTELWQTVISGKEWRGELCNKKKNGELYWESASISPILDSDGTITHFVAVKEDITERKQAEADLIAQQNLLQKVIEQSADGIVVIDPDFNFLFFNDFAEKILEIGKTEPKPEEWQDTYGIFECDGITPFETENFPHIRALKGETVRNFEMFIRNTKIPEGKIVSGNASPLKNDHEQIIGAVGTFHDITRNKKAEEILEKAHRETRQILASISSILIGIGPNEEISQWNTAAEQTFGIKKDAVIGKGFLNCGIKWDWLEVLEHISRSLDNEKPTKLNDIRFTRPDDTEGFLDITINRIADSRVEHAGYLLIATEITERKNLESQLSNAQKLESIGQLAAGIAHEINTPIQYVGDNAHFLNEAFERVSEVLKKSNELLKATKENSINPVIVDEMESIIEENKMEYILDEIPFAIKETLGGVERVANIVRAMKEFSHPGNEEKALTDINKALDSTITVSRNEWKYVAEMEKDFDPSIPLVPCLTGELNQVFLNLIVNAAHAIADAAKQGNEGLGKIKINSALKEDFVEVRISDTGTGIPLKIRKKVFDPFFTTKEVGKGTGQGLAISHNVVKEKHGGELTFETKIGKGTTFIVRLPVKDSKA